MKESRAVSRDVEVMAIPYGDRLPLPAGTTVYVMQALGGSFTLMTDMGYMVRLDGLDADAIGEQPLPPPSAAEQAGRSLQDLCWDQLRTCYDPEIPVNIVDLGLVYACEVSERPEGGHKATVRFTLTAPGCGMGDALKYDMERKLLLVPGVREVEVQVALDPPWEQSMMSEAARLQLGLM